MAAPWVIASRNPGKLVELRAFFATHAIDVIDLREAGVAEDRVAEDAIEAFDTFEANALAKARYFASCLPGRVVLADDSGLEVDALGGRPGVRSKRWSGRTDLEGTALERSNNALLVQSLAGVAERGARFVCAAAWCDGRTDVAVRGEVAGHVVDAPAGEHGFGYDPHVVVHELGKTMAEATVAEKERVSHRGRALVRLLAVLRASGHVPSP